MVPVKELLERYPPGRARYDRRFGLYAKRVREQRLGLTWRHTRWEAGRRLREALSAGPQATSPPKEARSEGRWDVGRKVLSEKRARR